MMLTDFHAHILPGVDDGSESLEQSLQMLQLSAEQGVGRIVATPHFYPQIDDPAHFLQRREQAFSQLQEAMALHRGLPRVELGAEVFFFQGISECEDMHKLTLGGKKHILIEMPMVEWTAPVYRELEQIYRQLDLIPVVAHLDRYLRPFTWRKVVRELGSLPVLIQANGEFFLNRRTEARALSMLDRGQIHILGSDCHDLQERRPNLDQVANCIGKKLGQKALDRLARYADEIL